ncbi:MAG: 5-formyltetrahydrofolate cyclo-ligase [Desulfococcaceae bacterium]|jgi:5-formyltetrahydrofolate cyclo-ligase|nr:5-formyltetrahydrofolate cyclo-ligase [Desulfococcaceae bacterium]
MDENKEKKNAIREEFAAMIAELSAEELAEKTKIIEDRLFEFANFVESRIPLLYMNRDGEIATESIIRRAYQQHKIVTLPIFDKDKRSIRLMKVDDFDKDLKADGPRGVPEPDPEKCKKIPLDKVDIAIIPGLAFDEKGGRIGSGLGYYDRLIPKLSATTRKVALCLEKQIIPQVPMESHDRHVDIIITDERIIYKI